MRWMKGRRALASGMLVLALTCAAPAISAAQDAGTTTAPATTTVTTAPTTTAPTSTEPTATAPEPVGGTPGEAAPDPRTAAAAVADSSPPAGSGGGAKKSASTSVTIGDFFFRAASITVHVGDTVTWNNTGQAPHNATASDGTAWTPTLNDGESASHTFDQAGTFSYICSIHPNMKGTVRVLAASSGGGGGDGGGASSSAGSSGSSSSEAAATSSPSAAGDSNTLPMTGMAVGGLALAGLGLLALGLVARQAERRRTF
jgi:plastocyanin